MSEPTLTVSTDDTIDPEDLTFLISPKLSTRSQQSMHSDHSAVSSTLTEQTANSNNPKVSPIVTYDF